jgi:hypothetical protein
MMRLFVSRNDAYATQGDPKEIKAGRAYLKVDAPVTTALIQDHLDGKLTVGVYSIDLKTQTTKTVAWDLDYDIEQLPKADPEKIVEKLKPQVKKLIEVIKKHGFDSKATLIEFSGAKGVHLWLFFEPAIPSIIAYALGRKIAEEAGVDCEVFPKQRELLKNYGNLLKLPLGIHRGSGLRSVIYDSEWRKVGAEYLAQIRPEFLDTDGKNIQELKSKLDTQYRPWMNAEIGRGDPYVGEDPPCVTRYLSGMPIQIGQRHEILRRLACYFLTFKGWAKTQEGWARVRQILEEWNKHNTPPYDAARFEEEWRKLKEGYEYNYGCTDEYWQKTCDPARCLIRRGQLAQVPGEVSLAAIEKARELMKDPVKFVRFLQQCFDYRLAGEYANRLFMFLAALSARVQTTMVRIYGSNAAGKRMLYYWLREFLGEENVVILSSSTAAWLKRKVLGGFDTRGKVIILIEERGDFQGQVKYQFEQVKSEDKFKICFNIRGERGDWEPVEVELQGPLTFITTSTELEISLHGQTREWEVNPDESPEQSKRIDDWFNERELVPIKKIEEEKKQIEVIRAFVSLLKPYDRYVIPFIYQLNFEYKTLADRRKKPDLANLIRTTAFVFQELCPKDEENKVIFAPPFIFDIVMAASAEIIAVSRGALNRTEKRILDFVTTHDEILSVTRHGKTPQLGFDDREVDSFEAFTVDDLAQRPEFANIHPKTIRENLKGLSTKGWLQQTVKGQGRPGVWMRVQQSGKSKSDDAKHALIPQLEPVSDSVLNLNTSTIYDGLERKPVLTPTWNTVLPSLNVELSKYRIPPEKLSFEPKRPELASSTSTLPSVEVAEPEATAQGTSGESAVPDPKYWKDVTK